MLGQRRVGKEGRSRWSPAPTSPKDIGISKELFHNSLLKGYTVRPRYSIMQFAKDNGRLEEIADKITEEIYG